MAGLLSSDNPLCEQPGTTVEILQRDAGSTSLEHLAFVNTGVGGTFEHEVIPEANVTYSAVVPAHDVCAEAVATPITLLVSPKITVRSTVETVKAGRGFWVTGKLMPEHQLAPVTLWRKLGPNKWKKVATAYLDESSRYSVKLRYVWKSAKSVLRVRWKATDGDHASGRSPKLVIRRAT